MKKQQKRKIHHNAKDIGIREAQIRPSQKTDTGSYYTGAKRVSGLHNLLSCHHRSNGKGVQVPVGDISRVEGGECRLG